jgi:hypothetical protein
MSSLAHFVAIAEYMLAHFGGDAPIVVDARVREHHHHADLDGAAMWRTVGRAVREIQRIRNSS